MTRPLGAALVAGGIATLLVGAVLPLSIAVPVVVGWAILTVCVLAPRLTRGLTTQIEQEREFSANASHQLKTPLAALRFRLDDLMLWPETSDVVKSELVECLTEVDRLTGNVEDLLALARDGRPASSEVAVDLSDAAASAVGRWRALFGQHDRALRFVAPPEAVLVSVGARPLLQVVDVLIENALAHGAGETEVRVSAEGGRGFVWVGDEGRVEPAVVDRIFDRSFRSATSAGSGIGLALARTIVDSIGGRLTVRSLEPTSFELSFALA